MLMAFIAFSKLLLKLPLANIFLGKYGALYNKTALRLSEDAIALLQKQPWLGNIRELEHVIEKAVIICDGPVLEGFYFEFPEVKKEAPAKSSKIQTLEEMEYAMIKNAMEKYEGNLSLVASQLGISRQTLYNKLKRYGL